MNINPSLLAGLAMAAAERRGELSEADRRYGELRVYPESGGAGYYFVMIKTPGRWYWKDEPGADHFCQADMNTMAEDLDNSHVQIVGDRKRSLALWTSCAEFEEEIGKEVEE
jgi:hypothetical protein